MALNAASKTHQALTHLSEVESKLMKDLESAREKFMEQHPIPRPAEIQKPKLVSFGPIHHSPQLLEPGEQHKQRWAKAHAGEDSNHETGEELLLLQKIKDHIMELKELYTEDVIRGKTDDELASILFVDGCAELYFLKNADIDHPEKLNIDVDQMLLVQQDLLLLGNQVPYKVLDLLSSASSQLMQSMEKFCKMLRETKKAMELLPKIQTAKEKLARQRKTSRPKIQRVQETLLGDHGQFELYYKPKVVSFGPIHNRLALGESKKFMWAAAYMAERGSGEDEVQLCQKIANNITRLKEFYTDDAIEGYSDEELACMLFVDGCAMLYFLKAFKDSDFRNIQLSHVNLILCDLLLLENQLPYELLKLLTERDRYEWLKECMDQVHNDVNPFENLKKPRNESNGSGGPHHALSIENLKDDPIHLLDHIRKRILARHGLQNNDAKSSGCLGVLRNCCGTLMKRSSSDQNFEYEMDWAMNRNIQNLKEAGILRVKRDDDATMFDISFHPHFFAGYLHLPPLLLGESKEIMFHNLKAYEICPDFDNKFEICSFITLFNSLINCEEDVKELRSAHILLNRLSSDTEVVELFRNLTRDPIAFNVEFYVSVQDMMNKYFKSGYKTWVLEGYCSRFRSPWSVIFCMAAGLGLLLALLQTLRSFNSRSG